MDAATLDALLTGSAGAVGVLVAVLLLLITGKLVPGWVYDELRERARKLEDQVPQTVATLNRAVDAFHDGDRHRA